MTFKKLENQIVEVDGKEVEIKPYISTPDLLAITKLCIEQFENNENFENFVTIKLVYDLAVCELCTNISFDGIKSKTQKGVVTVSLDLDADKIAKFEGSQLRSVLGGISNYNEGYNQVVKAIELKNTYRAIGGLANSIPSSEKMGDALAQVFKQFKEMQEKDPEMVKVASESFVKQQINEIK